MDRIREAQKTDKEIASIKEKLSKGKAKVFREDEHDTLWFEDRVYVPNDTGAQRSDCLRPGRYRQFHIWLI